MAEAKQRPAGKQVLPLPIWATVAGLAATVVLLIAFLPLSDDHLYQSLQEVRYAIYRQRLENLRQAQARDTATYRVLIFGSSLTEHGVMPDTFFNVRFQKTGKKVIVNRVFHAGAYYEILEQEDFIGLISALQPDLLCIEDQALLYTPLEDLIFRQPLWKRIHKNYVFNLDLLKHRAWPTLFSEPGIREQIDPAGAFDTPHPRADSVIAPQDTTDLKPEVRKIRAWRKTPALNRELARLKSAGTELAILHLPRPGAIEKHFLTEKETAKKDRLIRQYNEVIETSFWQFDRTIPFSFFWDISHLNGKGQAVYSEWLFDKINKQITAPKYK